MAVISIPSNFQHLTDGASQISGDSRFSISQGLVEFGIPFAQSQGWAGSETSSSGPTIAEIRVRRFVADRQNAPEGGGVDANIGGTGEQTTETQGTLDQETLDTLLAALAASGGSFEPGVIGDILPETPFSPELFTGSREQDEAFLEGGRGDEGGAPIGAFGPGGGEPPSSVVDEQTINDFLSSGEFSDRQKAMIQGLLDGSFTPEQLAEVLADPDFQAIFNHPDFGPLLNPALELAVTNATAQAEIAAGVTNAERDAAAREAVARSQAEADIAAGEAGATAPGATLRAGGGITDLADLQRIIASGGFTDVADMLNSLRIQASGGLSDEADIFNIQQALSATNPFASLQLGGLNISGEEGNASLQNIIDIVNAQQSGQFGANAAAERANFLNFIGNPSAVGAAVGAGFDPFGEMQAALQAESDTPAGAVSIESAMRALETQGLPGTGGIGSLRGLNQNFTEGQFQDLSTPEQGQVAGQLSVQGITPDQIQERSRSFTPADDPVTAGAFV